jgi:tRNA-specific 2-thiouridylase
MKRVVVAMSGGVDSAVAAALLKREGYEVIGITMCFNLSDAMRKKPTCCGLQGIEDARRVAHKLSIRHYVLNMKNHLNRWVIEDFCQEYLLGRTPNPRVRCNRYLKFNVLLKKALSLDAKFLATGHYARIATSRQPAAIRYLLKKSKDLKKDQSYFLYRLNQSQLRHIIFPLADYTKERVRKLAKKLDLPVAEKLASQEICFLPDDDYRGFLLRQMSKTEIGAKIRPGPVVDEEGNALGQHKGIAFYTIGQREGLGIARGYPIYITKIDPKRNQITVGRKEDAYKSDFLVKEPHFVVKPIKKKIALKVRIRYNHREAPADIMPLGNKIKVCFFRPQFAITPGQSAVFYDKDEVLGGGVIDGVIA